MATLKYQISTFNGSTVDGSGNIKAFFRDENSPVDARRSNVPVEAERTGLVPGAVRSQPQATTWEIWIRLADNSEANVSAMDVIFNESIGTVVYITMIDGAGIVWRTPVSILSAPKRVPNARSLWMCPVRVTDPTLEGNTLNTTGADDINKTASPVALGVGGVIANGGNRDTEPSGIAITANVAKSENSHLEDFPYMLRGFLVNTCPNGLEQEPVFLFDQSAAQARLVTDTAASGAVVRRTTGATTLTADPGAAGATIATTSAAGFNVNGGLAILQWVTGTTFGTMECVYYTGVSGNNLTGCVRGLGGTTAQAHGIGTAIAPCGTMPNGDDVRVWFEDQFDYRRDIVNWNVATGSDIVINVTLPKAVKRTLIVAMASASVPAIGAVVNFVEGNAGLDNFGFFACGNEIFHYSAKSGTQGVILDGARGLWQTTAAAHATSVPCYFNPKRYVVALGWAKATPPPADYAHRACIELPTSSNQVHRWGNTTSDPLTTFFDRLYPDKPKSWLTGFDKDGSDAAPNMALTIAVSPVQLEFVDNTPGDSQPPANFVSMFVPQGVKKADANAINVLGTPTEDLLNLELLTRDQGGSVWKLQKEVQAVATPTVYALPAGLTVPAYEIKLKARYNTALGFMGEDATIVEAIVNTANSEIDNGVVKLRFTLDKDTMISKIRLRMKKSAAGTQNVSWYLRGSDGGSITENGEPVLMSGTITAISGAAIAWYEIPVTPGQLYKAGTYTLSLWMTTTFTSVNIYGYSSGGTQNILLLLRTGGAWQIQNNDKPWISICCAYNQIGEAPVMADQPVRLPGTSTRSNVKAIWDNPEVKLEAPVYVHRNGAFVTNGGTNPLYHLDEVIANATSGDTITLDKWMTASSVLTLDFVNRTVTYVEDGISYPLLRLVTAGMLQMLLKPGNNVLTATDPGLISPGQVSHVTTWRDRRI